MPLKRIVARHQASTDRMLDFDYGQWRVLHTASLKHMFRAESRGNVLRDTRRISSSGSVTRFFTLAFCSLMCGGFCALLLARATPPFGEFLAVSVISYFTLSVILDRGINSLLTKEIVDTIGIFPISSTTFLASHVSSAITYAAILCGALTAPSFIAVFSKNGAIIGLGWLLSIACCVVFLCFAATAIFVFLLRVSSLKVFRAFALVAYIASFLLLMWLIVLFTAYDDALIAFGDPWKIESNSLFLFFPPFWFLCLYLVFEGTLNSITIAGSVLAVLGSIPFAYYLFSRLDTQFLVDLSEELASKSGDSRNVILRMPLRFHLTGTWGRETFSIFGLAYSHLKYDAGFRSNITGFLPVLILFLLVIPFVKGAIPDPFIDAENATSTTFIVSFALFLLGFVIIDACRESQQRGASWLLFMSPMGLSTYTVKVIDWAFITLIVPILVLLTCVFTFVFNSFLHSLLLAATLGWQTYAIMNAKFVLFPILPFTENLGIGHSLGLRLLGVVIALIATIVIAQPLAHWIYSDYSSCVISVVIGAIVCAILRFIVKRACDRKFRHLEFVN